jgi:hypothetical protein
MRASRRWLPLALAHLLWSVPAISFAQPQAQTPSPQSALSPDQEEEEEIQELEEEVGDRDPTYLRTRTVFRYDHRLLGPASIDRFRLRLLYGFGPKQRYAVSALGPIVQTETLDSFYDVSPGQIAPTLKPGVSRAFGPNRRWVASAYYGIGLNDYARLTQYRYNAGVDITWYPRKYR